MPSHSKRDGSRLGEREARGVQEEAMRKAQQIAQLPELLGPVRAPPVSAGGPFMLSGDGKPELNKR